MEDSYCLPDDLADEIFRCYDIRGIVGEQLTANVAYAVGLALGKSLQALGKTAAAVARDVRPSSESLQQGLIVGLRESGCDVIHIGAVPTPLLYFATILLRDRCFGSGFMITGSHNPSEYNGIKMVMAGKTLHGEAIEALKASILAADFKRFPQEQWGSYTEESVVKAYEDDVCSRISLSRPLHVVVDSGNGMASEIAPALLTRLGVKVDRLYCELDGRFPNHHPDPTVPENLKDLIAKVKEVGADVGLAFDGDADRLGVVTPSGDIIWPDLQMMLYARDLLTRQPGAHIVYDIKCTQHLAPFIKKHGGVPVMWKTGHSLLKAKMLECDAGIAGEMSGHIFFRENWYDFDDGIYAAARFLQILAATDASCQQLYDELPKGVVTPELKITVSEQQKVALMEKIIAHADEFCAAGEDAEMTTIDGLRVDFKDGFALLRASNTTPCIVARFEAHDAQGLQRLQQHVRKQLLMLQADLEVPF